MGRKPGAKVGVGMEAVWVRSKGGGDGGTVEMYVGAYQRYD